MISSGFEHHQKVEVRHNKLKLQHTEGLCFNAGLVIKIARNQIFLSWYISKYNMLSFFLRWQCLFLHSDGGGIIFYISDNY